MTASLRLALRAFGAPSHYSCRLKFLQLVTTERSGRPGSRIHLYGLGIRVCYQKQKGVQGRHKRQTQHISLSALRSWNLRSMHEKVVFYLQRQKKNKSDLQKSELVEDLDFT